MKKQHKRQQKILSDALKQEIADTSPNTNKGKALHMIQNLTDEIQSSRHWLSGYLGKFELEKVDGTQPSEGCFSADAEALGSLTQIKISTINGDDRSVFVPLKCAAKAYSLMLYRTDVEDYAGFIQFKTNVNPVFSNMSKGVGTCTLKGVKKQSGHPLLEVGHVYDVYYLKY